MRHASGDVREIRNETAHGRQTPREVCAKYRSEIVEIGSCGPLCELVKNKRMVGQADSMSWFEKLTGFREDSPDHVRERLFVEGPWLASKANGRRWHYGALEIPTLERLRTQARNLRKRPGALRVEEIVADVRDLHLDASNAGAVFQVASQFNLLEMTSPDITPEMGVGRYEFDPTQGPACATACGAGTIYRNYFVDVKGQIGQNARKQIDCLGDLGEALGNEEGSLWEMRNGYCLAPRSGLLRIGEILKGVNEEERERLKGRLRIGIQRDSEVTLPGGGHRVTQAYCSALPVGYSPEPPALWEPFARLILEAAYEATLHAALLEYERTGSPTLYLTLLGGGAFGNDPNWIVESMERALRRCRDCPLNVKIVSFKKPNPALRKLSRNRG